MSSKATAKASAAGARSASGGAAPEPPPLSFEVVDSHDDKREALRLVADSIAQQRQIAALAVIFHPLCIAGLVAVCAGVWRCSPSDLGTALTAFSGLVMAYLAAARLYTSPYLAIAEAFNCQSFLAGPGGTDDLVLAARFGHELIGTLVLRLQPSSRCSLIRAWTTRLRYRNKGIGGDLLRFAIAVTRSAAGDDALIVFDSQHANSALPLSRTFNHPFTSRDEKAAKALERAIRDGNAGKQQVCPPPAKSCDQLPRRTDVTTHGQRQKGYNSDLASCSLIKA